MNVQIVRAIDLRPGDLIINAFSGRAGCLVIHAPGCKSSDGYYRFEILRFGGLAGVGVIVSYTDTTYTIIRPKS